MKIDKIVGLESVKAEIKAIIENKELYKRCNTLPPHILFAGLGSGNGCTMLSNIITDEFYENKVRPFTALDFSLEFKPDGKNQDNLNSVLEDIQTASVFKNNYEGNVFICLDKILPYVNDSHVMDFFTAIADIGQHATLFFFLDTSKRGSEMLVKKLKETIHGISVVEVTPYSVNELAAITKKMIADHGVMVNANADTIIARLVSENNITHAKECVYLANDLIKFADLSEKTPSLSAKELRNKVKTKGVTRI